MSKAQILLVEDDTAIATVIRVALEAEGLAVDSVETLADRDRAMALHRYGVIVTDVILPDGNGLATIGDIGDDGLEPPPFIVLSAQNTLDTAVSASECGAFDYLPKPFDLDELTTSIRAALQKGTGAGAGPAATDSDSASVPIIGRAPEMQLVYRTLAKVAPTDLSVLILGESGTGKELVAQAIHASSRRKLKPFVAVNMAAIPRELIESELFGHERGAFTGAVARTSGRFEQAEGGTLFLDEIGDMPLEAQTRLLRVLQTGEYSPVGSARLAKADVRILAATNQDLGVLVADGRFREDLFYRLNVIPLQLPRLRDRRSDIGLLAEHFLAQAASLGLGDKSLAPSAISALERYNWPGNVRELGNVIQRVALLTPGREIAEADVARLLPEQAGDGGVLEVEQSAEDGLSAAVTRWLNSPVARDAGDRGELHQALVSMVEQTAFDFVLAETSGNQLRAAARLGINRNTLRLKRGGR